MGKTVGSRGSVAMAPEVLRSYFRGILRDIRGLSLRQVYCRGEREQIYEICLDLCGSR